MNSIQEQIKKFRELPVLKSKLDDLFLRKESIQKIKSTISEENYKSLNENYLKQIQEFTNRLDLLQSEINSLKNEIILDSKLLSSEVSITEKELQETQFLYDRNALSKADYNNKRNSLQKKINTNRSLIENNRSKIKKLDFYNSHVGTDSGIKDAYKQNGAFIFSGVYNFISSIKSLSFNPKNLIIIGVIMVLIVFFLFFMNSKSAQYSSILPDSYSKLKLGMTLDKFHSKYSERDYKEDYNRDGSLSISFKLNKATDYKYLNSWELEFKKERLYSIVGICTYTSEREELCNMANEIDKLVKKMKYDSINQDKTYDDFPNCIAYKQYYLKLKTKGMPYYYSIDIINDLNARRWGRDSFKVLIQTEQK
ncbi:MAG: hypothetical protein U0X39_05740 [Bacteroidales bacterium]